MRSPWGLYNTVGNACEWCGDSVPEDQRKRFQCGAFGDGSHPEAFTCHSRVLEIADMSYTEFGFRVARDFRP